MFLNCKKKNLCLKLNNLSVWGEKNDYLPPIKHKTNFRWIVDLNIKGNTMKLLADNNIEEYLNYCGRGNDFLRRMKSANHKE